MISKILKKCSSNDSGFSLVEVLLAIVILALITTPIVSSFVTSMNLNKRSKEIMAATDMASSMLESFENGSFELVKNDFTASNFSSMNFSNFGYFKEIVDTNHSTNPSVMHASGSEDSRVLKFDNLHYSKNSGTTNNYMYYFDAKVTITKHPSVNSADQYFVYDVVVIIYEHETDSTLKYTNALCEMSGSTFNKK